MFSRRKAALPLFLLWFPMTKLKYGGTAFPLTGVINTAQPEDAMCM
jgi:hypothetical protein